MAKSNVGRVDKRMRELAVASGVPPERTDEAVKGFAKLLIEEAGFTPETVGFGDDELDEAAKEYFALHASSESAEQAATNKGARTPKVGAPIGRNPKKLSWK